MDAFNAVAFRLAVRKETELKIPCPAPQRICAAGPEPSLAALTSQLYPQSSPNHHPRQVLVATSVTANLVMVCVLLYTENEDGWVYSAGPGCAPTQCYPPCYPRG